MNFLLKSLKHVRYFYLLKLPEDWRKLIGMPSLKIVFEGVSIKLNNGNFSCYKWNTGHCEYYSVHHRK